MKKKVLPVIILFLADLFAFYVSLFLAVLSRQVISYLYKDIPYFNFDYFYFLKFWWMPLIFILFIGYEKLYIKRLSFWDEVKELLKAISISTVVILAVVSLGKLSDSISRLTIIFLWLYGIFIFPLFRFFVKRILYKLNIWQKNVLIIGAGEAGKSSAEGISNDYHLGYKVVGFLDDYKEGFVNNIPILGKIKDFDNLVDKMEIDTVIVAIPSMDKEKLTHLINDIHKKVKKIFVVPDLKGIALLNSELYHLFMQQIFLIKIKNNLDSKINQFIKSTFDITVSIIMLPVLLPLIFILGLLIKLDSPGPIFFTHQRIGKNGKVIKVYKFRTMYIDAEKRLKEILQKDEEARKEWETYYKLKNDPRVTKIGKFLRKTSLDELPQIFNVLKGEMSLVGPRPVIKDEIEKYYKDFAEYYYMVKPGITGLWQVSGRSNTDYDFRVEIDTCYVLNWSLWLDIIILFKTIKVVLKREGAY